MPVFFRTKRTSSGSFKEANQTLEEVTQIPEETTQISEEVRNSNLAGKS